MQAPHPHSEQFRLMPGAHVARNMGLTRQAVQRLVNEIERDLLVRLEPKPRRAKLVLTARGKSAYDAAMKRQGPWVGGLANGLSTQQIEAATATMRTIRQRLEARACNCRDHRPSDHPHWTSTIASELSGSPDLVAVVKQAIPWGFLILVPTLGVPGASGFRWRVCHPIPGLCARSAACRSSPQTGFSF